MYVPPPLCCVHVPPGGACFADELSTPVESRRLILSSDTPSKDPITHPGVSPLVVVPTADDTSGGGNERRSGSQARDDSGEARREAKVRHLVAGESSCAGELYLFHPPSPRLLCQTALVRAMGNTESSSAQERKKKKKKAPFIGWAHPNQTRHGAPIFYTFSHAFSHTAGQRIRYSPGVLGVKVVLRLSSARETPESRRSEIDFCSLRRAQYKPRRSSTALSVLPSRDVR